MTTPRIISNPTGADGSRQLVARVNQVRQRVARLRQLCRSPLRQPDLVVIQRVADDVRRQAGSVSEHCVQRCVRFIRSCENFLVIVSYIDDSFRVGPSVC